MSREAKNFRNDLSKFLPSKIGVTTMDVKRCWDIDRFYLNCQDYRDWYKNVSKKLYRPDEFEVPAKKFATRPDPTSIYEKQPVQYHQQFQPITYPHTFDRRGRSSFLESNPKYYDLTGHLDAKPCLRFKR